MTEKLLTGILSLNTHTKKNYENKFSVFYILACVYFYLQAGIYIYQLVDWYSSSLCMCLGGGLEFVAVAWYYGKFYKDP